MTDSTTPPCGLSIQSQTHRTMRGMVTVTYFTSQHLSHSIPAWITQLALAKRQRLCIAARAKIHAGYTDGADRRRSRPIESRREGGWGLREMRTQVGSRCLSHSPYCCYTLAGTLITQKKQQLCVCSRRSN